MKVPLKNTTTGDIVQVKVGWSWTLFFFSSIFGIPLFLRKLHLWGCVFLGLCGFNMLIFYIDPISFMLSQFVIIGMVIWFAIRGNEMTAKNLLKRGYEFVDPEGDVARFAKARWGLPT